MNYKWTDDTKNTLEFTDSSGQKMFVPVDQGNREYQDYLEWVAEGNTAESA
tara:strand:- start:1 stop:153 length:153 start_codon:yes stop_codon:yes gene_type:complete